MKNMKKLVLLIALGAIAFSQSHAAYISASAYCSYPSSPTSNSRSSYISTSCTYYLQVQSNTSLPDSEGWAEVKRNNITYTYLVSYAPGTYTKSGTMSKVGTQMKVTVYAHADAYASGTWTYAYSKISW